MMLFFSFRETNKAFLSLAAENSPSMCCTEDNYDRKLSAGAESALCRLSSSKPTTVVERRRVQQFMRNQKKTPACLPTLAKLAIIIPRRDLLDQIDIFYTFQMEEEVKNPVRNSESESLILFLPSVQTFQYLTLFQRKNQTQELYDCDIDRVLTFTNTNRFP